MIPAALAELGTLTELKIESSDSVISFSWPKTGRNSMILAANSRGTQVFGLRGKIGKISKVKKISKTATRYTTWSDYDPTQKRSITISSSKRKKLGDALSLSYRSDKWDGLHDYFHDFETPCSVYVDCDDDPTVIIITGKSLRVTRKGIEG